MATATFDAPDLGKTAPRSPRASLGGLAVAARVLDKCRAEIAGTAGDFHYNCPLDRRWFGFTGIQADAFKTFVATGANDTAVGEWIQAHAKPRSALAVAVWNVCWWINPGVLFLNLDDWMHSRRGAAK